MGHSAIPLDLERTLTPAMLVERDIWTSLSQRAMFPRLYAILDAETLERRGLDMFEVATIWRDAGIGIVQYRDKVSSSLQVMSNAVRLRQIFSGSGTVFVLNDTPALAHDAGVLAAHIGQTDGPVDTALRSVNFVGVSTHNEREVAVADGTGATYIAIGPVFSTPTKRNAEPVVGLEGVRSARSLTRKPLVGIGGVTLLNAGSVLDAGADSVAVISALLDGDIARRAQEFLSVVGGR